MIDKHENLDLFSECIRDIDAAYKELGHTLGWRFLSVSKTVLQQPVKIAFITLNPGGNYIPPDHPWESCENGVSYLVERWGALPGQSTLQIQVQKMFSMIRDSINFDGTYQQLMAQSLISHYIPFRSPRFGDLPRKQESVDFGRRLWTRLLPEMSPHLVICLGREVQTELRALIPTALSASLEESRVFPIGWGKYTADIDRYSGPYGQVRLLFLPHLSTFKIFTSDKCRAQMPVIIGEACRDL